MAPNPQLTLLHPDAPDEVMGDQHLYAAWCYQNLSAEVLATFKERHVSVAALLAIFRDEWRRAREEAIDAQVDAATAPGAPSRPSPR